jgi:hypothetical protein
MRNRRCNHSLAGGGALRPGALRRGGEGGRGGRAVGGVTQEQVPIPADELVITPEQQAAVDALAGAALADILLNMLERQREEREAA